MWPCYAHTVKAPLSRHLVQLFWRISHTRRLDFSLRTASHSTQPLRLRITSNLEITSILENWSCNKRSSLSRSNRWIKPVEWRAEPNLISSIRRGRATLDLISSKTCVWTWSFVRLLFKLKLQNVSELLKLQGNLQYSPSSNLSNIIPFPFSKGSHHQFRRSLSKAQTTQAQQTLSNSQFGRFANGSCWINWSAWGGNTWT